MLLLLVRHAVTRATGRTLTGRLPGHHLSRKGLEQAEALSARLSSVPVKAIYSSPLERCRETAEVVAAAHRLRVRTLKDVAEVDYGEWQGRSLKSLYRMKIFAELLAKPADFRFPGGESIREAQTRGMRSVESLLAKHTGQVVAVFSHADLIRLIVAGYLGLSLDLYGRMSVGPASVSALLIGDRIPRLLRFADSGALDDLVPRLEDMTNRRENAQRRR